MRIECIGVGSSRCRCFFCSKGREEFVLAEANGSPKEYLTEDDLVFKTMLDIGKVNPKEYPLKVLELAEKRVLRKTNKTFETAINSVKSLQRGSSKKKDDAIEYEVDEYGLSEELYSPSQIKFIRETIQSYYDAHTITTPYQKSGIIRLAKLECNINDLEVSVARSKHKEDINNMKELQKMHKELSDALQLQTKQAKEGDKGEDAFANAVIAFEERFQNDQFEFENIETKDKMSEIMINNADRITKLIDESKTYFAFRKAIAESAGLKAHEVNEIGYFTIEELFDFKKQQEDRSLIENKNEDARDPNFVDRESGEEDE